LHKSTVFSPCLLCVALLFAAGCDERRATAESPPAMKQIWSATFAGGEGEEGLWTGIPVIAQGMVIVGIRNGMAAFDTANGRQVWRASLWSNGNRAYGFIAEHDGRACMEDWPAIGCVDVATGKVLWSKALAASTATTEAALDGSAWYVGTDSHMVYALDPASGAEKWATDVSPGALYSSRVFGLTVSGDTVYATTVRDPTPTSLPKVGDLVALDRATGRILFTYSTSGSNGGFQGAATISGPLALMNDTYTPGLVAVDRFTQREVWRTPVLESGYINSETRPVLVGDTLFAASSDTQVYSVNAKTGAIQWKALGVRHGSLGSIAVCKSLVLAVEFGGGSIIALDRASHGSQIVPGIPRDIRSRVGVAGEVAYAESSNGVAAYRCR
jgi:outer membrane protein assembly factor BamB